MKFQGSLGRSDTESLNAGVIYEYHSSKYADTGKEEGSI